MVYLSHEGFARLCLLEAHRLQAQNAEWHGVPHLDIEKYT